MNRPLIHSSLVDQATLTDIRKNDAARIPLSRSAQPSTDRKFWRRIWTSLSGQLLAVLKCFWTVRTIADFTAYIGSAHDVARWAASRVPRSYSDAGWRWSDRNHWWPSVRADSYHAAVTRQNWADSRLRRVARTQFGRSPFRYIRFLLAGPRAAGQVYRK